MPLSCHKTMPAKHRREGLKVSDYGLPACFEYPLKHGPFDPDTGARLSKEEQLARTKGRIRNAASRFGTFAGNLSAKDRARLERAIARAKAKHGIGEHDHGSQARTPHGDSPMTEAQQAAQKKANTLRNLAKKKGLSAEGKKSLLEKAAEAEKEAKGAKSEAKPAKKKSSKKAGKKSTAAKPAAKASTKKAGKKSSKKAGGKKHAAKKAHAKKPATAAHTAPAVVEAPKQKAKKKSKAGKKSTAAKASTKKSGKKAGKKHAAKKGGKKAGKKHAPKKGGKKRSKRGKRVSRSTAIEVRGRKVPESVKRAKKGAKRVSTTSTYKKKGGGMLRISHRYVNPVGNWANVGILGGGALVGYLATDAVDRLVATRAGDQKYPWYAGDAATRIMLRPDGMRIAAQIGMTAVFFVASLASQKKLPRLAYFFAGAAIGAGVHALGQAVIGWGMPAIFKAPKGTEKNIGNRLYPMEQGVLQAAAAKQVEAEDKDASATGQGGDATSLPDSYAYPAEALAAAGVTPTATAPQRGVRRVAGVGDAAPSLPQGRPTIQSYGQKKVVNEPVARPAAATMRTAPLGRPGTLACGGCGRCSACRELQQGIKGDRNFTDGLNVKNQPAVEAVPAGSDGSVPQVDVSQPQTMSPQGAAVARAVGASPYSPTNSRPNGRPKGLFRPGRDAGLLGGGGFRPGSHLGSHLN